MATGRPAWLTVTGGRPTDAELAAVTAALAAIQARTGDQAPSPAPPRDRWGEPARLLRRIACARLGGWRTASRD